MTRSLRRYRSFNVLLRSRWQVGCALVWLFSLLLGVLSASPLLAQTVNIEKSLRLDRARHPVLLKIRPWRFTREKIFDATEILRRATGIQLGISYTNIYQSAPEAPSPHYTWVSSLDLYTTWDLVDSNLFGEGSFGGLFRYRTNFGPVTGNELAQNIGLPWSINNSGSDGYARFNQLWWQQSLFKHQRIIQLGKIDPTTHFDQNRVASSDARDFMMQSLVNSQTIAFPSQGLGFNVHYAPSARFDQDFGLSDANGDPERSPHDSWNSFFKGQYFQAWRPVTPCPGPRSRRCSKRRTIGLCSGTRPRRIATPPVTGSPLVSIRKSHGPWFRLQELDIAPRGSTGPRRKWIGA